MGPELEPDPDDGRLRIRLCGAVAEQAWPFACQPGEGNPLRVDPECGLWLPPPAKVAAVSASGSTAELDQAVPADYAEAEAAEITITNPSACHEAMVFRLVGADVDLSLPPGADAHAAARLGGNEFIDITNPAGSGGTEMSFTHFEYWQPFSGGDVIPPGGAVTYRTVIEIGQGSGGARYRGCRWSVQALVFAGLA